ncbi:hypothetical protein BEQ56_12945 [Anaerolineaceae bacterium oral taxon 439]|nr:hypothetical protein BEQ56_12945 [Anaerolineaceae bacterium oral taxon 439]
MKTFKQILPILLAAAFLFAGAAVPGAAAQSATPAMDILIQTVQQFEALPGGSPFSYTFPEETLNQAAAEALRKYESEIKALIRSYVQVDLSVSDPKIDFTPFRDGESNVHLSVKAGYGFLKLTVKAAGALTLENGQPSFELLDLDVPIISIPISDVNLAIANYFNMYGVNLIQNNVALTKIETTEDGVIIEGTRR